MKLFIIASLLFASALAQTACNELYARWQSESENGPCSKYAPGEIHEEECIMHQWNGVTASQVCPQCDECTLESTSTASTGYEFLEKTIGIGVALLDTAPVDSGRRGCNAFSQVPSESYLQAKEWCDSHVECYGFSMSPAWGKNCPQFHGEDVIEWRSNHVWTAWQKVMECTAGTDTCCSPMLNGGGQAWTLLHNEVRQIWTFLGESAETWDNNFDGKRGTLVGTSWSDLTNHQWAAAARLCFDEASWNERWVTSGFWVIGGWGLCSATCGDGVQTRSVTCSSDSCLSDPAASHRTCNFGACPAPAEAAEAAGAAPAEAAPAAESGAIPCDTDQEIKYERVCTGCYCKGANKKPGITKADGEECIQEAKRNGYDYASYEKSAKKCVFGDDVSADLACDIHRKSARRLPWRKWMIYETTCGPKTPAARTCDEVVDSTPVAIRHKCAGVEESTSIKVDNLQECESMAYAAWHTFFSFKQLGRKIASKGGYCAFGSDTSSNLACTSNRVWGRGWVIYRNRCSSDPLPDYQMADVGDKCEDISGHISYEAIRTKEACDTAAAALDMTWRGAPEKAKDNNEKWQCYFVAKGKYSGVKFGRRFKPYQDRYICAQES